LAQGHVAGGEGGEMAFMVFMFRTSLDHLSGRLSALLCSSPDDSDPDFRCFGARELSGRLSDLLGNLPPRLGSRLSVRWCT
jgi:hypothetical protein